MKSGNNLSESKSHPRSTSHHYLYRISQKTIFVRFISQLDIGVWIKQFLIEDAGRLLLHECLLCDGTSLFR